MTQGCPDMTKEQFTEAMRRSLREHRERFPHARAEDVVKFVFQGYLGVGHLLGESARVEERIAEEMSREQASPEEALTEDLGPFRCRLNLRRAMAEGLTPRMIAAMMRLSEIPADDAREDVIRFCRTLAEEENDPDILKEALLLRDGSRLPSHSVEYREHYRPAYRVVSGEWRSLLPAIAAVLKRQAETARVLVTVDGPCASGKTTLARKLAEVLDCDVIHTDDFVVPHARKTPERLAVPGGNCDWERLTREVTGPWKDGSAVLYRKYDCHGDRLKPPEAIRSDRLLILEGCYCNLPPVRECADVRLFLETPEEIRAGRLVRRESPESLKQYHSRWIPLENAYFEAYGLPDPECIVLK